MPQDLCPGGSDTVYLQQGFLAWQVSSGEGSQAPSCVWDREEDLLATGTFCSVNSTSVVYYLIHGRVFLVYFCLVFLRSLGIAAIWVQET